MADQGVPPEPVPADPSIPVEVPAEPVPDPIGDALKALMVQVGTLEAASVKYRQGLVTTVSPSLSVALGASDVSYTSVSVLSGVSVEVGDVVAVLMFNNDMVVIGGVGTILEPATPVGTVISSIRSSIPGWLLCNGQSASAYPALAAYLSAAGLGSNVPNLTGRAVIGAGGSRGIGSTAGALTHTLTELELPAHDHTTPSHTHTVTGTAGSAGAHNHRQSYFSGQLAAGGSVLGGMNGSGSSAFALSLQNTTIDGAHTHPVTGTAAASPAGLTGNAGGGNAFSVEQPDLALNYFIRT